jgi:hypothetical protein
MSYDNTNSLVIFKNNKKEKDTHPDYTGSINVEGKDYSVSLWIKEGKAGKFFSGKIQEPFKKMENTSDKIARESSGLPFNVGL